jgi:hypothetical protein
VFGLGRQIVSEIEQVYGLDQPEPPARAAE